MKTIHNLSFRMKLLLLISLPMLGVVLFSGYQLNQVLNNKRVVEQIQPLVELSIVGSRVVHELQKERGATSGFVGSNGLKFISTLKSQRKSTGALLNSAA
ncbi:nitrate- and nitrite sensing domain-containing protein [Vibrio zhugei]|uniref:Nitrate- and nitrite sensing domain-containing protein n=1 Tax=Vibrio zhugei TaxID=2479546 RepID=A0ABV7CDX9_9VIBR|nr:nitrate- and nitrite sensing domain-containing protein [Vibrio zhugei]